MNIEACVNMAFSANFQIYNLAEEGANAVPENPRQHEALHVGLSPILTQLLLSRRQLSVVLDCKHCP